MQDVIDWANRNDGFISLLEVIILSILIPILLGVFKRLSGTLSKAVSAEEVRHIEKVRDEIYEKLRFIDTQVAFGRVLLRDVARDKLYFDGDEGKFTGPSPSYRVDVEDTDVWGLRVWVGQPDYIKPLEDGKWWCLADKEDPGAVLAYPLATVPYSMIVAINWHGDPAFPWPHIYCEFTGDGGFPYKRVDYCEKTQPDLPSGRRYMRPLVEDKRLHRKKF